MILNIVFFALLCGIFFVQFKEKYSLTGVCKRMQRLEAAVVEEKLTPAIVAKQDLKAIEAQKSKWSTITIDDFPNYEIIKGQLGNDEWSHGALCFAYDVYQKHGLLFDRAESYGHLFAGNLDFTVFKTSHVKCEGIEVYSNKKFTRKFKKFMS